MANLSAMAMESSGLKCILFASALAFAFAHGLVAQTVATKDLSNLVPPTARGPVLINFWATWCGPCKYEFPFLVDIDERYRAEGLTVNAVSVDKPTFVHDKVPEFLKQYGATMPSFLLDTWSRREKRKMIRRITPGFRDGYPFTVLFDGQGKIVFEKSGVFDAEALKRKIEEVLRKPA